jgi:cytochrome c oxidase cbb3-type subunit 4
MYKNILQNIDNIAIWPVISFVIFFAFFIGLLWWVFTRDKDFIAKMKAMPMNESDEAGDKTLKEKQDEKVIL